MCCTKFCAFPSLSQLMSQQSQLCLACSLDSALSDCTQCGRRFSWAVQQLCALLLCPTTAAVELESRMSLVEQAKLSDVLPKDLCWWCVNRDMLRGSQLKETTFRHAPCKCPESRFARAARACERSRNCQPCCQRAGGAGVSLATYRSLWVPSNLGRSVILWFFPAAIGEQRRCDSSWRAVCRQSKDPLCFAWERRTDGLQG